MIAVIDTCCFIDRKIDFSAYEALHIPPRVFEELKSTDTLDFYKLHSGLITITKPSAEFVKKVFLLNKSRNLLLSQTDIDVVALVLTLQPSNFGSWVSQQDLVECLTSDFGIKHAINLLCNSLDEKIWKYRCYCCFQVFDSETVFCPGCGYKTVTRTSFRSSETGELVPNLKRNFSYKQKELLFKKKEIRSADQKEFARLCNQKKRLEKRALMDFGNL